MSSRLEESAILGLRAQILDNLRRYKHELDFKEVTLTTVYDAGLWTVVVYDKRGYPICSTKGGDDNVMDALRNMLKNTSERTALSAFVDEFLDQAEMHKIETSAGIEYID